MQRLMQRWFVVGLIGWLMLAGAQVTWAPTTGAVGYKVLCNTDDAGLYLVIARFDAAVLTYTDTAEPVGVNRYLVVPF